MSQGVVLNPDLVKVNTKCLSPQFSQVEGKTNTKPKFCSPEGKNATLENLCPENSPEGKKLILGI